MWMKGVFLQESLKDCSEEEIKQAGIRAGIRLKEGATADELIAAVYVNDKATAYYERALGKSNLE